MVTTLVASIARGLVLLAGWLALAHQFHGWQDGGLLLAGADGFVEADSRQGLARRAFHHERRRHDDDGDGERSQEVSSDNEIPRFGRQSQANQVPEQLPIVISSSDNSYVSASPVEASSGRQRARLHRLARHRHHPSRPHESQTRRAEADRRQVSLNLISDSDEQQQQQISSDISTTATTTQRNKGPLNNMIHFASDLEPGDELARLDPLARSFAWSRADNDDNSEPLEDASNQLPVAGPKGRTVDDEYRISAATIIRTRESIDMGATFINYTIVTNLNACLVECWITDSCDTAIYQETPVDFVNHLPFSPQSQDQTSLASLSAGASSTQDSEAIDESAADNDDQSERPEKQADRTRFERQAFSRSQRQHQPPTRRRPPNELGFFICYLFECVKPDGFKCQFTTHNYYVSSTRRRVQQRPEQAFGEPELATESSVGPSDSLTTPVRVSERPAYSRLVRTQPLVGKKGWHDAHIASIRIVPEEHTNYGRGGLNSAIIAIMFGIGATGMLVVIVGHKMKSIKRRIAYKGRHRSLVPDADFLINTMPI